MVNALIQQELPDGMIIVAVSDAAREEMDPMAVLDSLEREWKETTYGTTQGN